MRALAIGVLVVALLSPFVGGTPARCDVRLPPGAPDLYAEPESHVACAQPGVSIELLVPGCENDHWSECRWEFTFIVRVCAQRAQDVDVAWVRQASGEAGRERLYAGPSSVPACPSFGETARTLEMGRVLNVWESIHLAILTSDRGAPTGFHHATFVLDN